VQEIVGEQKQVHVIPVKKNNDTTLDGLVIIDNDTNISPTIYLNPYYSKYISGQAMENVVDDIIKSYEENKQTEDFDTNSFRDFNRARQKMIMKVVNTARNKELLKTIPHRNFESLSIVYMVLVTSFEHKFATILINNEHMKMWQATEDELYEAAMRNTPALLPYVIEHVGDIFKGSEFEMDLELDDMCMYILTNITRIHGATTMMYSGLLKEIKEQLEDNFYLIPSSVHELLVIPEKAIKDEYTWDKICHLLFIEKLANAEYGECFDFTDLPLEKYVDKEKFAIKDINKMIREVNNNELDKEEVLDDYVYFFDGENVTCKK
jgi:hypothetical protein